MLDERTLMDALGAAAMAWRGAQQQSWEAAAAEAARRYNAIAATLIGLGVTRYALDPMDRLPEALLPSVWQEAYADAFADAVEQRRLLPAAG
jgi:hypothetical protein